jgi:hypothetical protein
MQAQCVGRTITTGPPRRVDVEAELDRAWFTLTLVCVGPRCEQAHVMERSYGLVTMRRTCGQTKIRPYFAPVVSRRMPIFSSFEKASLAVL